MFLYPDFLSWNKDSTQNLIKFVILCRLYCEMTSREVNTITLKHSDKILINNPKCYLSKLFFKAIIYREMKNLLIITTFLKYLFGNKKCRVLLKMLCGQNIRNPWFGIFWDAKPLWLIFRIDFWTGSQNECGIDVVLKHFTSHCTFAL